MISDDTGSRVPKVQPMPPFPLQGREEVEVKKAGGQGSVPLF